jgi:hypothetical protein
VISSISYRESSFNSCWESGGGNSGAWRMFWRCVVWLLDTLFSTIVCSFATEIISMDRGTQPQMDTLRLTNNISLKTTRLRRGRHIHGLIRPMWLYECMYRVLVVDLFCRGHRASTSAPAKGSAPAHTSHVVATWRHLASLKLI